MEQLRFIPVAMFLTGITLIYAGFTNQRPLDILRGNLGGLANTPVQPSTIPFTSDVDPYYAGTQTYRVQPSMSPGPRLFTS